MKTKLIIWACLTIALALNILPMPYWVNWIRPEFCLLVLIYWVMAAPEHCGLLTAACLGIFSDSVSGAVIGQHVLSYTVVVSIVLLSYKSLRSFDVWQQAGIVFILLSIEQLLEFWLEQLFSRAGSGFWFMLPVLISTFAWPWLMLTMRALRRYLGLVRAIV